MTKPTKTMQRAACWWLAAVALTMTAACGKQSAESRHFGGDTLALGHASLLCIVDCDSFTSVEIADAWNEGQLLQRYVLVDKSKPMPALHPEGIVVRTPIERCVCLSAVHAALLHELGAGTSVAGLCDASLALSQALRESLLNRTTLDMGEAMMPHTEAIAALQCEAILASPFRNNTYGAIAKLGIPIIECADYMESSPLGRAEWAKFFGLLFGRRQAAFDLFEKVSQTYDSLSSLIPPTAQGPTLLADKKMGAVWYVPGAESTMGRLYKDGGANYIFSHEHKRGSVALNLEEVYERGREADLWIIKYGAPHNISYASLRSEEPRYALFEAWKNKRIWGCNTMKKPFFEEVPFHPERYLHDVLVVCHPELFGPDEPTHFLEKLQ